MYKGENLMDCLNNKEGIITIVKGDDTSFGGQHLLTLFLRSDKLDLNDLKANFTLLGTQRNFYDLSSGQIVIDYNSTETSTFPIGIIYGDLKLISKSGKTATIENRLAFNVISVVHGNAIATKPYEYTINVEQGGENILNIDVKTNLIQIQVGDVETLPAGSEAYVRNRGDANEAIFDFGIPEGDGIKKIEKTSTAGLVDTYTITTETGKTTTYEVTNGSSIHSIEKTGTDVLTDTYTVTLTNGNTSTFDVTNGRGIVSISKTGTSGLVDTYTVLFNDNTQTTFEITNGKDATINGVNAISISTSYGISLSQTGNEAIISGKEITDVVDGISSLIPQQATEQNKLADKAFVNSSIASNTGSFIGTFDSVSELEAYSGTLVNNDYAFVVGVDSVGNTKYDRYKYTTATTPASWIYEYTLNNSSFTAEQWASINSSATQAKINQISTNQESIGNLSALSTTEKTNLVDSVNELNSTKQANITGGASTITTNNLTENKALVSNSSGKVAASGVTSTELGYLSGVTGSIQDQFSDKQDIASALNYKDVTNCITAISKDINLVLNTDGTVTLKAGSVITDGDGIQYTTAVDRTSPAYGSSHNGKHVIFVSKSTGAMQGAIYLSRVGSDTSLPANGLDYDVFFNTTDRKMYLWSNSQQTWGEWPICLPVAVVSVESGLIKSIDNVFNGFGYIGKTVYALPGTKALASNGFNADGTFKNTEYNITSLVYFSRNSVIKGLVWTLIGNNNPGGYVYYRVADNLPESPESVGQIIYLRSKNKTYNWNGSSWTERAGCVLLTFDKTSAGNSGIDNFCPREVLSLEDLWSSGCVSNRGTYWRTLPDRFADVISVKDFGAVGNGVEDDTDAINRALAYIRSNISQNKQSFILDLCGGSYRINGSINATKIVAWCWGIKNGTLLGYCTGKAVLDLTASRGYHLSDLYIKGDQTNIPRVGLQCARGTEAGFAFCDNNLYENVNINGYFSLAAIYTYGQESTTHLKCQYWNGYVGGYAAIHTGKDFETYQSDFVTTITGDTSFINDKYINCDYRLFPTQKVITGITQANPCVVTVADASIFSVGDGITFNDVGGMTELNYKRFTISAISGNDITINTDSTGYTAYTSGGYAIKAHTKATILLGRMAQHSFDHCYVVNYGESAIEYRADSVYASTEDLTLDFLFEGFGAPSFLKVNTSVDFTFKQTLIKNYGSWFENYMISQTGSQTIYFKGSTIDWGSNFRNSPVLFDDTSKYHLYGVSLNIPNSSMYDYSHYYGITYTYNTNAPVLKKVEYDQTGAGTFTPTVTASSGEISEYTASGYAYRYGKMMFVSVSISITDNGTGAAALEVSGIPGLPAAYTSYLTGRENSGTGKQVIGRCQAGQSKMIIRFYDNTYPGGTGRTMELSGIIITS